ncbi:MAG: hypothetical protein ACREH6_05720 [Geminicoccaceae bacterium]
MALRRARGIWLEDPSGHPYMDFDANSVHDLGHGRPWLIAALKAQA